MDSGTSTSGRTLPKNTDRKNRSNEVALSIVTMWAISWLSEETIRSGAGADSYSWANGAIPTVMWFSGIARAPALP